jgi:MEMO1 family protein
MPNEFPRLRNGLEALPIEHGGKRMILLRDRMAYSPQQLVLSDRAAVLLIQMDGASSLRDLQAVYLRETGELLFMENIEELVRTLDEHLFLENERFLAFAEREKAAYRDEPVRKMSHAGRSYPEDPAELSARLQSFSSPEAGGPGDVTKEGQGGRVLCGLAAPHIDIEAGGASFAHAYATVRDSVRPATWIVLGTGHEPIENCFALTVKDFETPLGRVRCDARFCEELIRLAPLDIRASERCHKTEHSVEFQAVFLAFVQPEARIVPMLCSFGQEEWESAKEYVDSFAALLRDLMASRKDSVGILASVDLAHIGPRYGDRFRPNTATVREHYKGDRRLFEHLERCDADGFMQEINRDQERRKVCGAAPLYLLAKVLGGRARGEVLSHAHAVVDSHNSFVTFASMAFYDKEEAPGA